MCLEPCRAELLLDPDGHARVGVGAGDALREVLDDGLEVGVRRLAVERRWFQTELGGAGTAEREQGDNDENCRDHPSDSIHLQVGQGRPPRACLASYQMGRTGRPGAGPAGRSLGGPGRGRDEYDAFMPAPARILVVEDEARIAEVVQSYLDRAPRLVHTVDGRGCAFVEDRR